MDIDDISDLPEGRQLLDQQGERFQRIVRDQKDRRPSRLARKAAVRLYRESRSTSASYMPQHYHPCVQPLAELEKTYIKDLAFGRCKGKYILVHSIEKQERVATISTVVEDERKSRSVLQSWYYDKGHPDEEIVIPKESVLVIKEPYLEWRSEKKFGIRIDHPNDVIFLSHNDNQIPDCWEKEPEWNSATAWTTRGNDWLEKHQYRLAIECYTRALDRSPAVDEIEPITLARCRALIDAKQFDAALSNLDPLTAPTTINSDRSGALYLKAMHLKAEALYSLQEYRKCCDFLTPLCKVTPPDDKAHYRYKSAIDRMIERQYGKCDFKTMVEICGIKNPPILDNASYSVPVEVRPTPRGRGLFTTKAVNAGDLLFCEMAFTYAFQSSPPAKLVDKAKLVDAENDIATVGTQMDLLAQTVHKLYRNPSLLPIITNLDHGTYQKVNTTSVDGNPVIDAFLIKKIIDRNAFGCSRATALLTLPKDDRESINQDINYYSCGIWPKASLINHSCNVNARCSFIGDMMIVRATRDLEANTEITWSYRAPGTRNYDERQARLSHRGFTCDCPICEDEKRTTTADLRRRNDAANEVVKIVRWFPDKLREAGYGVDINLIGNISLLWRRHTSIPLPRFPGRRFGMF